MMQDAQVRAFFAAGNPTTVAEWLRETLSFAPAFWRAERSR
jgi:hypothetical protein